MIVKLQSPLNDPTAMWLVYSDDKALHVLLRVGVVPEKVRDAVRKSHGKAYFEASVDGKVITFGEQVGEQEW